MTSEWSEVRLRDVSELITKGTTPTTLGMDFATYGINYIKAESITHDGSIDRSKFAFIDSATHEALRRSQIQTNDLLMSMAGVYLGKVAVVPPDVVPANTNQALAIIRLDMKRANPRFIAYYLRNPVFNLYINNLTAQSAQPNLNLSEIGNLLVTLPTLDEQSAIANILGTLDDKIELNRKMNQTLEAMARAIFKSWFVDFEPVRAKAEGRDPGLPPDLAALFPDSFEDSELGEIPKGWMVTELGQVVSELVTGGRPKGGVSGITEGVPSIGAESIVGLGVFDYSKTKYVPSEFYKTMTKGQIKNRDVLLYKDGGRPGEFEPHVSFFGDGFPFEICAINEHVYRIRSDQRLGQAFLYFWLSGEHTMEEMRMKGTGVAIPGLNSTQVKTLTTLVPESIIIERFEALVEPLIARIFSNCNESRQLASVRDALLPKLLSGEIRVKDGEMLNLYNHVTKGAGGK